MQICLEILIENSNICIISIYISFNILLKFYFKLYWGIGFYYLCIKNDLKNN